MAPSSQPHPARHHPRDFPGKRAPGTAASAQHFRAAWHYLFTVLLERFQPSQLCHQGGLSTAVGYPLDTVKVRIQTENHYRGFWHCVQETYRTEKVVLTNPSEVAKVRMQTQRSPHPSITHQPASKPKYQGSLHCLKVIIKEEGFGGLYKGCSALLCRDCSASAIYFLSYSAMCDWLTPDGRNKPGFLVVLLSGGFAGVLAWGLATPMDVIKSRMQTDESDQHKYKGLIHCVRESVRKEGPKVLFKGLGLNCIRAFPVNMVVFVTYEGVLRFTDRYIKKK
ncbi:PREDICTED: solute carrier family 25 member 47 isoform X3 [Ficedula albicollis]|uniref:solute carrier family 25 member 47 isoform X3 n=1 Tax=Ficedula albicollis TaxID=59894 RepID=UPI000359ED95|nr:PREDICTED: solute carrier family 25 member 47 isoform X3 [Ficedula albicollis]